MNVFKKCYKLTIFIAATLAVLSMTIGPAFAWFLSKSEFSPEPSISPFRISLSSSNALGDFEFRVAYPLTLELVEVDADDETDTDDETDAGCLQIFRAVDNGDPAEAQPSYVRFIFNEPYPESVDFIRVNGDNPGEPEQLRKVTLSYDYSALDEIPSGAPTGSSVFYVYPYELNAGDEIFVMFEEGTLSHTEVIVAADGLSQLRWGVEIKDGDVVSALAAIPGDARVITVEPIRIEDETELDVLEEEIEDDELTEGETEDENEDEDEPSAGGDDEDNISTDPIDTDTSDGDDDNSDETTDTSDDISNEDPDGSSIGDEGSDEPDSEGGTESDSDAPSGDSDSSDNSGGSDG